MRNIWSLLTEYFRMNRGAILMLKYISINIVQIYLYIKIGKTQGEDDYLIIFLDQKIFIAEVRKFMVHTSLTQGKPQPEIKGTEIFPLSTVADSQQPNKYCIYILGIVTFHQRYVKIMIIGLNLLNFPFNLPKT